MGPGRGFRAEGCAGLPSGPKGMTLREPESRQMMCSVSSGCGFEKCSGLDLLEGWTHVKLGVCSAVLGSQRPESTLTAGFQGESGAATPVCVW